jgi:hypothetical protein
MDLSCSFYVGKIHPTKQATRITGLPVVCLASEDAIL